MNLLLHGGTVVTSLHPVAVERLDILVRDGRVADLGASLAIDVPSLDCSGCLIVPGNVNVHMHAYSALARGMPYRLAPPTSFLEILQRIWWRLDRALDAQAIRASAYVAAREAVLAGTTTLVDHHASPNAIGGSLDMLADTFEAVGLRSILAYEVTERDGPERAAEGLAENDRFLRHVAGGGHPLSRGMVGAHAAFTLSDEALADCARLARDTETGVHVHVAEDAVDSQAVHRLQAAGVLRSESLVAHCVHVDEHESAQLRDTAVTVAHNPRSNMNNGVGRAPVAWLGNRVALGTDGIGSDMWEESRSAYLRRREEDLSAGPDWPLERLAVGARFAGHAFDEPLLGRVVAGAPADLVVLDYLPPTALDAASLAGHWVFGLSSAHVRDVVIAGELVVRDRRLTRVDEADLTARAREESQRLWARLEDVAPHPFEPTLAAVATGGK